MPDPLSGTVNWIETQRNKATYLPEAQTSSKAPITQEIATHLQPQHSLTTENGEWCTIAYPSTTNLKLNSHTISLIRHTQIA